MNAIALAVAITERAAADISGRHDYGDAHARLREWVIHNRRADSPGHWRPLTRMPWAPYCSLEACPIADPEPHPYGRCAASFLETVRNAAETPLEAAGTVLELAA